MSGETIVHDDLDEAFSTLTGLSVITLYNCIDLISSSEESREHFFKADAMQIVWCRLLTASPSTVQQIGLPTEMLLNTFCCMSMLEKYYTGMYVLTVHVCMSRMPCFSHIFQYTYTLQKLYFHWILILSCSVIVFEGWEHCSVVPSFVLSTNHDVTNGTGHHTLLHVSQYCNPKHQRYSIFKPLF